MPLLPGLPIHACPCDRDGRDHRHHRLLDVRHRLRHRLDRHGVFRGIQCLRLVQRMQQGEGVGTECQSRLGAGAERRARSAADAGDRAVVVQPELAQVQRLAELRPAAPKALTGVTQRAAAPAAEQPAPGLVSRQLALPLEPALPSLRALQAVQQRPAPRQPVPSLRLAAGQRFCVSMAERPRPG